jgi:transcriptional regulator with XRE-family HTH domain
MMRRFDSTALWRAMDVQRSAQGQSWNEVADAIGVSVATITRMRNGGRMEVDGMLAMVSWLGVPVETFVRETSL